MGKVKTVSLKIARVLVGIVLLAYSVWLFAGFFIPGVQAQLKTLLAPYPAAQFLLPDIFSRPAFSLAGLFFASIYLMAGINAVTLSYNGRIAAVVLVFSVLLFFLFFILLLVKDGFTTGFPLKISDEVQDDAMCLLGLSVPSIVALVCLVGQDEPGL